MQIKKHWTTIVFAVIFTVISFLSWKLFPVFTGTDTWKNTQILNVHTGDFFYIVLWFVGAAAVFEFLVWLMQKTQIKTTEHFFSGKIFLISFLMNIFFWGLQFLVFNPGCGFADSLIILRAFTKVKAQHPIIYILYLSGFFRLFMKLTGSATAALMIISIIQMLVLAFLVAWVSGWITTKGLPKWITYLFMVYFACQPLIGHNSFTMLKDPIFAVVITLLCIMSYEISITKGSFLNNKWNFILFVLSVLVVVFSRNNGIYVVLASCVFWFIFADKKNRIKLAIVMGCVLVMNIYVTKKSGELAQEALAVPIQQAGMVTVLDEDNEIPEDYKEVLEYTMPYERWKELYHPWVVDAIKWSGDFNHNAFTKHKSEFLKVWAKYLPKYFKEYCMAYLYHMYYIWNDSYFVIDNVSGQDIFPPMLGEDFSDLQEELCGVRDEGAITKHISILPQKVEEVLSKFYGSAYKFPSAGVCLMIMITCSFLLIAMRQYKKLMFVLPAHLVWATLMLATPYAPAYRYVYHYLFIVPLTILIVFINEKTEGAGGK